MVYYKRYCKQCGKISKITKDEKYGNYCSECGAINWQQIKNKN